MIRVLTPADGAAYRALRLFALRESPDAFGSTYQEDVVLTDDTWAGRIERATAPVARCTFGAFDGDELVGVVTAVQEGKVKTRHKAAVLGMYVSPGARGRGLGRELLTRLIAEVRTWSEVERLTLTVNAANHAAMRLYAGSGFTRFGRAVDGQREHGRKDTVEHMALALSP